MTTGKGDVLWARLLECGLVEGGTPARGEATAPWFVRLMLGVAGWIGALFLLGFVGAAFALLIKNAGAEFVVGVGACTAAAFIFRGAPRNDFIAQFGLAVSLAGQVLTAHAVSQILGRSTSAIAFFLAFQQALLFVVVPNFVHRLWASWSAAFATACALQSLGLAPFAPAVTCGAFLWLALSEFRLARHGELVRPGIAGLALATLQTTALPWSQMDGFFGREARLFALGATGAWVGLVALAAVLVWGAWLLLKREQASVASPQGRIALATALILGLVCLKAPGAGPAAAVLVVGFANANRVISGLGILGLLSYLAYYYHSLQATLLEKSGLLVAAGVALLVVRFAMQRLWPEPEEASNA